MNDLEKKMLDAVDSSKECGPHTGHSVMVITEKASKLCSIIANQHAEEVAIGFVTWRNGLSLSECMKSQNGKIVFKTDKELYQQFLKETGK